MPLLQLGGSALGFAEFSGTPQKVFCAFPVPIGAPDYGQVENATHFPDGFVEAALELALGGLRFATALVNHADVIMRHQVFGCEGDGLLEVVESLLQLPGMKQRNSQTIVRSIVVWVDFQTPTERPDCLRHVSAMVPGNSQIVMGQHETGGRCHCLLVAFDSTVNCALVEIESAQHVVREHMLGFGRGECDQRLLQLPRLSGAALRNQSAQGRLCRHGLAGLRHLPQQSRHQAPHRRHDRDGSQSSVH